MSQVKTRRTEELQPHKVLREVYRHYTEFEAFVAATGKHVIDYNYPIYDADEETVLRRVPISISFFDLKEAIEDESILSERKRQAVLLNVILDKKQKEVAEMMGITTVSVGQYVDQAMLQLAEDYFSGDKSITEDE
jgi:DNA-directed RNA polymerase specialized sigma subunit